MQAGRELDALVAEKVMGWSLNAHGEWLNSDQSFTGWHTNESKYDPCHNCGRSNLWHPSTSIEAAWEVVEKMGGVFRMSTTLGGQYRVTFSDVTVDSYSEEYDVGRKYDKEALADTAPHAICLAALKAVGHKF